MESKPSNVNTDIFERGRREGRQGVTYQRLIKYEGSPTFESSDIFSFLFSTSASFADNTRPEFVRVFKNFIPLGWHGTIDVRGMLEM